MALLSPVRLTLAELEAESYLQTRGRLLRRKSSACVLRIVLNTQTVLGELQGKEREGKPAVTQCASFMITIL